MHLVGAVVLVATLAPNVGRALGLAAALSVVVADVVLSILVPRSRSLTVVAAGVLAGAQAALVHGGIGALLLGELAAILVVAVDRADPSLGSRVDAAAAGVVRTARGHARRAGQSARTGAARGRAAVAGWARDTGEVVRRRWPMMVVGVVWALASIPVTRTAIGTAGDYAVHLGYASRTHVLPPWSPAPHPAFHLSVALLDPFLGLRRAAVVVMAVGSAATGVALLWVGRRPLASGPVLGRCAAVAFSLGYLVVDTPATLAAWLGIGAPEAGAPALHVFTNPTDTLAVPFALILTVTVAQWLDAASVTTRHSAAITTFALFSMVVKPSTGLVLLVAVPLHLATTRCGGDRWRRAGAWFSAPVVAAAALQTWWVEERLIDAQASGIILRPWRTVDLLGLDRAGPLLFTVLLVVPVALWAGRGRYIREPVVAVSFWAFVAGLGALLLLAEDGPRAGDGTFAKPGLMATIVFCLVSWRFLAGEAVVAVASVRRGGRVPAWLVAAAALLVVSLGGGVLAYLDAVDVLDAGFRSPA